MYIYCQTHGLVYPPLRWSQISILIRWYLHSLFTRYLQSIIQHWRFWSGSRLVQFIQCDRFNSWRPKRKSVCPLTDTCAAEVIHSLPTNRRHARWLSGPVTVHWTWQLTVITYTTTRTETIMEPLKCKCSERPISISPVSTSTSSQLFTATAWKYNRVNNFLTAHKRPLSLWVCVEFNACSTHIRSFLG